jgi:hypothetical protein
MSNYLINKEKGRFLALLGGLLVCLTTINVGAEVADAGQVEQVSKEAKVPWRGSAFIYRNSFSAFSLNRSAELTYNPYYAMSFSFNPRWWFGDHLYLAANLDLISELTESDITTYSNEILLSDLIVKAGYSKIYTIPVVDIDISADLVFIAPTSKYSQARTMYLKLAPGMHLKRKFDLLEGLTVGYVLRASKSFHKSTTAELETPLIPGCISSSGGCDAFLNTGVLNSQFGLRHTLNLSLSLLDWLGASLSFGQVIDWLYDIEADDPRISYQPQEATERRYATLFEASFTFSPIDMLDLSLGYSVISPNLAPDSTYYNPLYNRYATIFIDMQINFDGLISKFITN